MSANTETVVAHYIAADGIHITVTATVGNITYRRENAEIRFDVVCEMHGTLITERSQDAAASAATAHAANNHRVPEQLTGGAS